MSKAYKCDRCKELYDTDKHVIGRREVYETQGADPSFFRLRFALIVVDTNGQAITEPDLCLKCNKEILIAIGNLIGKV